MGFCPAGCFRPSNHWNGRKSNRPNHPTPIQLDWNFEGFELALEYCQPEMPKEQILMRDPQSRHMHQMPEFDGARHIVRNQRGSKS